MVNGRLGNCFGECGAVNGGTQTRIVRCRDNNNVIVADFNCDPNTRPDDTQNCTPGGPTCTCPSGYQNQGGVCVVIPPTCPSGYHYNGSQCVHWVLGNPGSCSVTACGATGTRLTPYVCQNQSGQAATCTTTQPTAQSNSCSPSPETCTCTPPAQNYGDGICRPPQIDGACGTASTSTPTRTLGSQLCASPTMTPINLTYPTPGGDLGFSAASWSWQCQGTSSTLGYCGAPRIVDALSCRTDASAPGSWGLPQAESYCNFSADLPQPTFIQVNMGNPQCDWLGFNCTVTMTWSCQGINGGNSINNCSKTVPSGPL
jgi:hypothetical protein